MSIKVTMKREPVVIQIDEQTLEVSHSDALELWDSLGKILGKDADPIATFRRNVMPAQQWNPPEPTWRDKDIVYVREETIV